ncbi:MAG: hypothetical protein QG552_2866 [Thermodesulfobacteriota bacterium]|nr:hypothetical protein [Thermodesulfobacteriota bacterium]
MSNCTVEDNVESRISLPHGIFFLGCGIFTN